MPRLTTDSGTELWYDELGAGRPVVFIHGWCMSSAIWEGQMSGLSGNCRVITLDLPGHGRSGAPDDTFSLAGCVEAIAALFRKLDLRRAVLCGWSLGSMVAIRSVPLLHDRLAGLVLVGGTPRFTREADYLYGLSQMEVDGMAVKVRRNLERAIEGFTGLMFTAEEFSDDETAAYVRNILAAVRLPSTATALQALQALVGTDLRQELSVIDLSALLIHGDRDRICLPGASDFMAAVLNGARQAVFPGCGHAPFLTRPVPFNHCLTEFLETLPS